MAITVTSKYKPFTYEELVKPLEGYWKEYEKYEDQLLAEKVKLADLAPSLSYFTDEDANLQTQYQAYKTTLEKASDELSKGLTKQAKYTIREKLLPMYRSHIVPLQEAFKKKEAAVAEYQKQASHNPLLLSSTINPLNMSVSSFYGAKNGQDGYFIEDGNKAEQAIRNQAAAYSSSITSARQARDGDRETTITTIGSIRPIISFDDKDQIVIENENLLDPSVADKIRKMYQDNQTTFRYSELDSASKDQFRHLFQQGLQNGWVHKQTTSSQPWSETYTPVYGDAGYTLTLKDGKKVTAPAYTLRNGSVRYLYNGQYYSQDHMDKLQDKENEERNENLTNKQSFVTDVDTKYASIGSNKSTTWKGVTGTETEQSFYGAVDYNRQARIENTNRGPNLSSGTFHHAITKEEASGVGSGPSTAFDVFIDKVLKRGKNGINEMLVPSNNQAYFVPNNLRAGAEASNSTKNGIWVGYDGPGMGGRYHLAYYSPSYVWAKLNRKAFGSSEKTLSAEEYGKIIAAIVKQQLTKEDQDNRGVWQNKINTHYNAAISDVRGRFKGNEYAKQIIDEYFTKVKEAAYKYMPIIKETPPSQGSNSSFATTSSSAAPVNDIMELASPRK